MSSLIFCEVKLLFNMTITFIYVIPYLLEIPSYAMKYMFVPLVRTKENSK